MVGGNLAVFRKPKPGAGNRHERLSQSKKKQLGYDDHPARPSRCRNAQRTYREGPGLHADIVMGCQMANPTSVFRHG